MPKNIMGGSHGGTDGLSTMTEGMIMTVCRVSVERVPSSLTRGGNQVGTTLHCHMAE